MAITGTGTQTDPYIVDTWADCVTVATTTGAHIKWADYEQKTIDFGGEPITQITGFDFAEIDFNGWEFKNFTGCVFYNSNLNHDVSVKNATFTVKMVATQLGNGVWFGSNPLVYCFTNPSTYRFYVDKMYFNVECVYSDLARPSFTFFNGNNYITDMDFNRNYTSSITLNGCSFNIKIYNRCNLVFAGCELKNCEIFINGHITDQTTNALRFGSMMYSVPSKSYTRSGCAMDNCYLNAQITSDSDVDFLLTPTHINNCIFDLKNSVFSSFANENNKSFYIYCQTFKNWVENAEINPNYVLLNPLTTIKTISNALSESDETTLTDLTVLQIAGFKVIADDSVRNPKYSENTVENWNFKIDKDLNNGFPFLPFWYYPNEPTISVDPVPFSPLIRVHDGDMVRDSLKTYDFTCNGIRILRPLSCKVTEELNGAYFCELEHYMDDMGDWLTLIGNNILSVPIIYRNEETQQLFRITEVVANQSSKVVKVTAKHIFYDLMARAILTASVVMLNGNQGLYYLYNAVYSDENMLKYWYDYQFESDITSTYSADYELTNLVSVILGEDNSLVQRLGGEIYRDNFYFSINKIKEKSISENTITYGVDMIDITSTVNWDNFANWVMSFDNFSNEYAVSYADFIGGVQGNICEILKFNYETNNREQLIADTNAYFEKVSEPDVNYSVIFADLRNKELYKDFINLENNEVGDRITVYNARMNINSKLKIIKKVYNVLKKETESIELGSTKASITRQAYLSNTIYKTAPDVRAIQKQLNN